MKWFLQFVSGLFLGLFLASCIQSTNSDSFDKILSRKIPTTKPPETKTKDTKTKETNTTDTDTTEMNEKRFKAAVAVLEKHCIYCHGFEHITWVDYTEEEDWIEEGLVVPNSPYTSKIITRLQNEGGDMPENAPPLSDDDYNALISWIENMQSP